MNNLIAVYGTLKQGGSNQRVLDADRGHLLGKGTTVNNYTMFGGYGFPRVVFEGDTCPIHVEVYAMDGLDNMDSLEGHPNFFRRRKVLIQLETPFPLEVGESGVVESWMYFHPPIRQADEDYGLEIQADGNWEVNQYDW